MVKAWHSVSIETWAFPPFLNSNSCSCVYKNQKMLPRHTFATGAPVAVVGTIRVFHPGYPDDYLARLPLMRFEGYDDENGGIWREVVLTACTIISNNRLDGKLLDKDNLEPEGAILAQGDYFWHVPGDSKNKKRTGCSWLTENIEVYPVIVSFRNWSMPVTLSSQWITTEIKTPEPLCTVLRQMPAIQKAHIIPESEAEWFHTNNLGGRVEGNFPGYNDLSNSVSHKSNLINLSSSTHHSFDAGEWTFFPKGNEMVVHCMKGQAAVWSNQAAKNDFLKEYMYARFAWTLFQGLFVAGWLRAGKERILLVQGKREATSGVACVGLTYLPRPPSTSQKRKKSNSPRKNPQSPPPSGSLSVSTVILACLYTTLANVCSPAHNCRPACEKGSRPIAWIRAWA